ncbi:MAG: SDR family oxidoreductase [Ruthenibacterium sp.]
MALTKALAKERPQRRDGELHCARCSGHRDDGEAFCQDKAALCEETPLCRLGTPQDIAAAVAFLASEQAGFVTGQVLGVNGGFVV